MLSFQLRKQLRDFSVDIKETIKAAETLVLIGHSGCGKSTTLRMLSGLISPDEGFIHLENQALWEKEKGIDLPPEQRNIGFVFQNYALFPHLTVADNIAYGISHLPKEEKAVRVEEVINLLGLKKLAHAKPVMLSGGEQQRVALARALVTRPKLLLLDEPLSALDISTRSHVRSELKSILRTLSIPSIVVTHDYEDARILGDRIAVMDRGVIIQSGSAKQISQYPASDFVAEFTGTNLLSIGSDFISFDPWRVEVTHRPKGTDLEWAGKILDIAWMGGFARLHITGSANFYADVPIEKMEQEGWEMGDEVFANLRPEDTRHLPPASVIIHSHLFKKNEELNVSPILPKKKWKWAAALLVSLITASAAVGYAAVSKTVEKPAKDDTVAFVAANATDPFNELIQTVEKRYPGENMEATYAGTQILRTQIEHGAKADLFLSADLSHIQAVKNEGFIADFKPVSKGHLVIVVQKNNPLSIHSVQDLGTKPLKMIIGVDSVPIGKYTRKVFENASHDYGVNFSKNVMSHVVSMETNVKQVLQKVAMGEADAGLVYRTDVTKSFADKVQIIDIDKKYNVESTNYISVLKNASHLKMANEVMKFMLSSEGQSLFRKYGYDPLN
jgi:molybdenum ABC transporter molybdate-binding protein